MITLITGAPGSGKTLYCIDKIIRPVIGTSVTGVDENGEPAVYERTVYSNINGLLLGHELVDGAWLEKLHENKRPGAFIVFDEVQRVWPNRPAGSKKPDAVEYLETHRHDGIDVVLLTQNPQLLDPAVRKLIGRHLHMRRVGGLGAAIVYEWDACSDTLRFKSAFTKTPYKYSSSAFKLYKSARVHTKQKRKLPFAVWMLLAGLVGAVYMWPHFIGKLTGDQTVSKALGAPGRPAGAASAPAPGASAALLASPGVNGKTPPMTKDELFESMRPRLEGLPHTAVRYDDLTKPTRVPYPAACISNKTQGCRCYSQSGTRMWLPDPTCRKIIQEGLFLDFEPDRAQVLTAETVRWEDRPAQAAEQGDHGVDGGISASDIARLSAAKTGTNTFAVTSAPVHHVPGATPIAIH